MEAVKAFLEASTPEGFEVNEEAPRDIIVEEAKPEGKPVLDLNVGGMIVSRHEKAVGDLVDLCELTVKSKTGGTEAVLGMLGKVRSVVSEHYNSHRQMLNTALAKTDESPNELMEEENAMLKMRLEHLEESLAKERAKSRHLEAICAETLSLAD